jgi:hypothetical protein
VEIIINSLFLSSRRCSVSVLLLFFI